MCVHVYIVYTIKSTYILYTFIVSVLYYITLRFIIYMGMCAVNVYTCMNIYIHIYVYMYRHICICIYIYVVYCLRIYYNVFFKHL